MNPGVHALEQLAEMGLFRKGQMPSDNSFQFTATKPPSLKHWKHAAGLIHKASSWTGTRGLSVMCGREGSEVVYIYRQEEDK